MLASDVAYTYTLPALLTIPGELIPKAVRKCSIPVCGMSPVLIQYHQYSGEIRRT